MIRMRSLPQFISPPLLLGLLLCGPIPVLAGLPASQPPQRVLHSLDFGLGDERDATPALLRMVEAARTLPGPVRLEIEPGTYHCYARKAYQKYCYITNHEDGLRSTPLPLIGMQDLEIVGEGVELVFHGLMLPIIIEDSRQVTIRGLSIDWELPLHCEVEVVAVHEGLNAFDVRIPAKEPYEIRGGELIFLREDYEFNLDRSMFWDPATMAVAYLNDEVANLTVSRPSTVRFSDQIPYLYQPDPRDFAHWHRGLENAITATELEEGLVRLVGNQNKLPKVGWVLVAKGRNTMNRLAPAIRIARSSQISLQGVTVHHAGGMGLIAERSTDITLDHFDVRLPERKGRFLTTTADATHFNNCRGLVRMVDCHFENMLDDGTNIHGAYTAVEDVLDGHTIGLRIGHFQQMGYDFAGPGDRIGFVLPGHSFYPLAVHTVASVEKFNHRYYRVRFRDPLDARIEPGFLMDNLDWYPEVEILNTTVINNRARALLLSTPHRTLVEKCTLSSMGEAIISGAGYGGLWFESGHARDLTIRGNTFLDGGYARPRGAELIRFGAASSEDEVVFDSLVIEDNLFRTFDPMVLNVTRVGNLVFRNNRIEKSDTYLVLNPDNPILLISNTKKTRLEGNTFETPFENKLEIDAASRANLILRNNTGLE
jgi:hypothetical protein